MSDVVEHIEEIDVFSKKLSTMGREGHLNDFEANIEAGGIQTGLSKLRELLQENPS